MLWKTLPQLTAFLMAILAANLDYVWHDRRTRRFRIARVSLFLLMLASLVTSVMVAQQADRTHEQEEHHLSAQLDKIKAQDDSHAKTANQNMRSLLQAYNKLQHTLAPFEDLARKRYPGVPLGTALNSLRSDISALQSKTATLEHETQKTAFRVSSQSRRKLADGSFEHKLTLVPVGKNIIPILTIWCQTENKSAITTLDVKGPTVPAMSYDKTAEDQTTRSREFRGVRPGVVEVTITTIKDPGGLSVQIDPLQKQP